MILVNKTFCETTPESLEYSEFSNWGFLCENVEISFRELIDELEKHRNPSCFPIQSSINTWFSSDFEIENYSTMTERQESLHYSKNNNARSEKYWKKAINYVFGNEVKQ